jgi:hypothetical protein
MTLDEALSVLRDRAAYLAQRVIAKKTVGWSWEYDERERAALQRVIDELARPSS